MTESPQPSAGNGNIAAVVVAFQADPARLAAVLEAAAREATQVALVDNAPGTLPERLTAGLAARRAYLPQPRNVGVAAAQNAGIRWALGRGAEHVLLLDHDSVPAEGMARTLLGELRAAAAQGRKVAAAGPSFWDEHARGASSFVRFGWSGFRRQRCAGSTSAEVWPVDFLISSGSLIPLCALEALGTMDEGLFLDHVDTEWCLRARDSGSSSA